MKENTGTHLKMETNIDKEEKRKPQIYLKYLSRVEHYKFKDMLGVIPNIYYWGVLE